MIEIRMPKNCCECRLNYDFGYYFRCRCLALGKDLSEDFIGNSIGNFKHPDCPLKDDGIIEIKIKEFE